MIFQCKKVNNFYQILAQELKTTQESHLHYQFALFCHCVLTLSLNIKLLVQCLFSFHLMHFLEGKIWYGWPDFLSTNICQAENWETSVWFCLSSKLIKALHTCKRGLQSLAVQIPGALCCRLYSNQSLMLEASTNCVKLPKIKTCT